MMQAPVQQMRKNNLAGMAPRPRRLQTEHSGSGITPAFPCSAHPTRCYESSPCYADHQTDDALSANCLLCEAKMLS